MLPDLINKIKRQKQNILLVIIVFLLVLLAFGAGMAVQFYLQKPSLTIETSAKGE
ncbi:MAG: hypothetical protein PHW31_02535 [Candidatus Pacebacteria bacterium]|nr:hypothetical protein [Candidatus Paceibacterota bacterium]